VVFSIEKFIGKCSPELKLAGIYVVDSIARTAAKQKGSEVHSYVDRFAEKLESLTPHLLEVPSKDKV
jgi:hypothetical protein